MTGIRSPLKAKARMSMSQHRASQLPLVDRSFGFAGAIESTDQTPEERISYLETELRITEELLAESQRDNERKHREQEEKGKYIKALERLLGSTLGPNWRAEYSLVAPSNRLNASICITTPLPKSVASRNSTALTFSNSRATNVHNNRGTTVLDFGKLKGVDELAGLKDVEEPSQTDPESALRKLEGAATCEPLSTSVHSTTQLTAMPLVPEIKAQAAVSTDTPVEDPPSSKPQLLAEVSNRDQLDQMTQLNAGLAECLSAVQTMLKASEDRSLQAHSARNVCNLQMSAVEAALADAEARASSREKRLQQMLSDVGKPLLVRSTADGGQARNELCKLDLVAVTF